jgi:hypothetical protein
MILIWTIVGSRGDLFVHMVKPIRHHNLIFFLIFKGKKGYITYFY